MGILEYAKCAVLGAFNQKCFEMNSVSWIQRQTYLEKSYFNLKTKTITQFGSYTFPS